MLQYANVWRTAVFTARHAMREKNDCAVTALAFALGIDYAAAHAWCKQHGRKDRDGMFTCTIDEMLQGFTSGRTRFERYEYVAGVGYGARKSRPSLGRFVREHPTGVWYVRISGHVFVVRDGVVFDGERCVVRDAWQIDA